jgi:hypothetical protein
MGVQSKGKGVCGGRDPRKEVVGLCDAVANKAREGRTSWVGNREDRGCLVFFRLLWLEVDEWRLNWMVDRAVMKSMER